jgi:gamma-glutamyltranspeptidase
MLQILDHFPRLEPGAPGSYVLLASAMHEAFASRQRAVADPDFVEVPVADLTTCAWADAATRRIQDRVGPNSIQPGKARVSGMSPTIVFDGHRPTIVSGAPGTNAIVTSVVQVIAALLDGELSPVEAVSLPRVHCEGGPVFVEGRISRATRQALVDAGFDLRPIPTNYAASFGRNQLMSIDKGGQFRGASDPRRDGGVAAFSIR